MKIPKEILEILSELVPPVSAEQATPKTASEWSGKVSLLDDFIKEVRHQENRSIQITEEESLEGRAKKVFKALVAWPGETSSAFFLSYHTAKVWAENIERSSLTYRKNFHKLADVQEKALKEIGINYSTE